MDHGGGSDERIGHPDPRLPTDTPGLLGDRTIDGQLPERGEEASDEVGRCGPGDQFGPRNDGVVEAVTSGSQLRCASEVVDEDVGIDEEVSHGTNRRGRVP